MSRALLVVFLVLLSSTAYADSRGAASGSAVVPAATIPARTSTAPAASGSLRARDPHAGDPHAEDPHAGDPHAGDPHAGQGHAEDAIEPPPEDTAEEDPSLPPGSVAGLIVDENEKPIPNAMVSIGVVKNTVAKGESRERIVRTTDAAGALRLDDLDRTTGTAYRVTSGRDGATFAAPPFRLSEKAGVRFKIHVYPVTKNVDEALIVTQSFVVIEIKDDRIQLQQLFGIWNFGKTAWVADTVIKFPDGFTGFAAEQGMTDVGVDAVEKVGVRLRGTVGPGQHNVEFRWQLPYDGEAEATIEAPMPPHLASARVIVPASLQMRVKVDGFPDPTIKVSEQGQRAYQTDRQFRREEPAVSTVRIVLSDLPQPGVSKPVKAAATGASLFAVAFGLVVFATKRREGDTKEKRLAQENHILEAIGALEAAKERGDVGPKTYERERRELIDQLAGVLATGDA